MIILNEICSKADLIRWKVSQQNPNIICDNCKRKILIYLTISYISFIYFSLVSFCSILTWSSATLIFEIISKHFYSLIFMFFCIFYSLFFFWYLIQVDIYYFISSAITHFSIIDFSFPIASFRKFSENFSSFFVIFTLALSLCRF